MKTATKGFILAVMLCVVSAWSGQTQNMLVPSVVEPASIDPLISLIETKLIASDGAAGDQFGGKVSLDGDTVLIGTGNQSAYVFVRSGSSWSEQAKLTVSVGGFGGAVCLDGDTALIGAHGDGNGSTYVFVRTGTTWSQQAKLTASDGAADDRFGGAVSLDGNTALIGAFNDDDNEKDSGSAYVFVRTGTTWSEQAKLTASDGFRGAYFGDNVSLYGDTALIGAWRDYVTGSAYVFVRDGSSWSEQAKLLASDGAFGDYFGTSVSLAGDTALISAYADDDNGSYSGSAYVFVRSGTNWIEQAKLTPSDGDGGDCFGNAVSLDGGKALIGAWGDDDNGSAYVFVRDGSSWSELTKLTASAGTVDDRFAGAVSLDGGMALIGAWGDDGETGSAYVFSGFIAGGPTAITDCGPVPSGFRLEWVPVAGLDSVVKYSPDLSIPFTPLSSTLPYPANSYTDTVHGADSQCFYRVDLEP